MLIRISRRPSEDVDQPAASTGPNSAADGADCRPGADRPAARFSPEKLLPRSQGCSAGEVQHQSLEGRAPPEAKASSGAAAHKAELTPNISDSKNQHAAPTETIGGRTPKEQQSAGAAGDRKLITH
jgi:hypothetical protein